MKTNKKLNAIKEENKTMSKEYRVLNEKELDLVSGGHGHGEYVPSAPSCSPSPSKPSESGTIPVKGEDTEHIDIVFRNGKVE